MLSTQVKSVAVAPVVLNPVENQYKMLVARLNDIHLSLNGVELDDDFISAYSQLCGQVFELAGEMTMIPAWLKNQEHKRLDVLMDKIRILKNAVDNAATQANYIRKNGNEPARVFEFRRAV